MELDRPVSALAAGPRGCYFGVGDSVYRLVMSQDGASADMLFLLALPPGAAIESIAADADDGVLYAATASETFAYHQGKVVPFYPLGGRIRCDGGALYISTGVGSSVMRIDGANQRAAELVDR
jgi:hypothetical protein